ncbi:MAG: hypothetical protein ACKOCD_05010 [Nitrospiraceae bacterium]
MDAAKQSPNRLRHKNIAALFKAVTRIAMAAAISVISGTTHFVSVAGAMHEVDHRFTIQGYVCGADGKPVAETKVIVKDTRVSIGTAVFTDSQGYYKAVLHLHNDNRGDPILVGALEREQRVTAQFDPANVKDERQVTVNIGSGCEVHSQVSARWAYYGVGVGLAAVAIAVGVGFVRRRQRGQNQGKGQRR